MNSNENPKDSDEQRDVLLKQWHEYGKTYNVFVPDEQPAPKSWDRPLVEPDQKGKWDPQTTKHWRFFELTRDFLRTRYAEHGILSGPTLIFDCLVPRFQKPLRLSSEIRKKYKIRGAGDPDTWYAEALEMVMTSPGEVGFECHSTECQRTRCKLNGRNPNRISPVDIYSLIQIFHGYSSVTTAMTIVAEEFGKVSKFEAHGIEKRPKIVRYAVPKDQLWDLIQRYNNMRRQHVPQLIKEAEYLISESEKVELEHTRTFLNEFAYFWPQIVDDRILSRINSAAVRLYLWLLVKQEEAARRNEWKLHLTDAPIARELQVTPKQIGIHRKHLQEVGLLVIRDGIWVVRSSPKFQVNT